VSSTYFRLVGLLQQLFFIAVIHPYHTPQYHLVAVISRSVLFYAR